MDGVDVVQFWLNIVIRFMQNYGTGMRFPLLYLVDIAQPHSFTVDFKLPNQIVLKLLD